MKYKTASGSNVYAVNWKTDTLSKHPDAAARRRGGSTGRSNGTGRSKLNGAAPRIHAGAPG